MACEALPHGFELQCPNAMRDREPLEASWASARGRISDIEEGVPAPILLADGSMHLRLPVWGHIIR
jgi:hypothetical protein